MRGVPSRCRTLAARLRGQSAFAVDNDNRRAQTRRARCGSLIKGEEQMIRLIAVAFALALASSAEAMPPVPVQQSDQMVIQVREGCGAGRVRRAGVCVARTTERHVRRAVRQRPIVVPGHPTVPDGPHPCSNPRGCQNQHSKLYHTPPPSQPKAARSITQRPRWA
jgi:hypothetical protein